MLAPLDLSHDQAIRKSNILNAFARNAGTPVRYYAKRLRKGREEWGVMSTLARFDRRIDNGWVIAT